MVINIPNVSEVAEIVKIVAHWPVRASILWDFDETAAVIVTGPRNAPILTVKLLINELREAGFEPGAIRPH